jgi:hypothetical protein
VKEHPTHALRAVALDHGFYAGNDDAPRGESRWPPSTGLAWAVLSIGVIPVAEAWTSDAAWGVEPTLGLVLSCLGFAGLLQHYVCTGRGWAQCRSRCHGQTPEV